MVNKKAAELKAKSDAYHNSKSILLQPFKVGFEVCVQDPLSKRWDKVGKVMNIGKYRDYLIKLPSGQFIWRNRKFLRQYYGKTENPVEEKRVRFEDEEVKLPRRSDRTSKKPDRFNPS